MDPFFISSTDVNLEKTAGNSMLLSIVTARNLRAIPIESRTYPFLIVATDQDQDIDHYNRLRFLLRHEIRFVRIPEHVFDALITKTWPENRSGRDASQTGGDFKAKMAGEGLPETRIIKQPDPSTTMRSNGSIISMVDEIFSRAIKVGASDIHLEPAEHDLKIRFRMDGVLHQILSVHKTQQNELISRIKILAHMDIAEKRRPQDGRILVNGQNKSIDVRVSSMPTLNGEKVVLRLLDTTQQKLDLGSLGMKGPNYEIFATAIRKPNGMVLVTGPTGSGKTTTLYAAIKEILSPKINISTVEDPIEYQLEGINQTQFNPAIDYTFAAAVKTFLRQDPDVIMVGEIRDAETAKYAIQASQTGHMVFSTLHTNDAPSAVVRLYEMGMEPYLVASTLTLVIAQRLVRCSCKDCGEFRPPTGPELKYLDRMGGKAEKIFAGKGCGVCLNSGYRGRTGVYEMMPVTPELQDLITEKAATSRIRDKAKKQGMLTLSQDALRLIAEGKTTIEEIEAVIG